MTIGELLERLKEQSMKEICKEIGVNTTTVQRKLKSLGYKWDNSGKKWYWGWEKQQPLELEIEDLINKPINPKPVNKNVNEQATATNDNPKKDPIDNNIDVFDKMINHKPKKDKLPQRGFYFEPEVIQALDKNVPNKYKSKFVNEALKRVLKEKGLL